MSGFKSKIVTPGIFLPLIFVIGYSELLFTVFLSRARKLFESYGKSEKISVIFEKP